MKKVLLLFLILNIFFIQISAEKKIVGLVAARNENAIIAQCLKALSKYVDAIVYLDDASDDNSIEIVESLRTECKIEKIIKKNFWHRDEAGDKSLMLHEGRKLHGTHFVVLDADEIFTSNCLENNFLRDKILSLNPGDSLSMNLIALWRSTQTYRVDPCQWTNNYGNFIFCDDEKGEYGKEFLHSGRVPKMDGINHQIENSYGVLHFQFVNWTNLLIKQAWYRCLERIRNPEKSIEDINNLYAPSKNEDGLELAPCPRCWFNQYSFFDSVVYDIPETWRKKQMLKWFQEYGRSYFNGLDLSDI